MSDTEQENTLEEAKADFDSYHKSFEEKYGYGIGATSQLTPDGRVQTVMQLVRIPKKDELTEEEIAMAGAEPTQDNVNDTPEEASTGDSAEQPEGEAA